MKPEPLKPIPTPRAQHLRQARTQLLPPIVFFGVIAVIFLLWQQNISAPTMVGQAEPVTSNITSHQPGVLTELNVRRFERVSAGQVLGIVTPADAARLNPLVDLIRTELDALRSNPAAPATFRQESTLKQLEAGFNPVVLRAPMDGIVTAVSNQAGESVIPGQIIVSIATLTPVRIVGYLRPPLTVDPTPGTRVEVRTRGFRRQSAETVITEIGSQFETLPASMQSALRFASIETGIPVEIAVPPELQLRAGELVDIHLVRSVE
jgi:multidrug resistance efflux pump